MSSEDFRGLLKSPVNLIDSLSGGLHGNLYHICHNPRSPDFTPVAHGCLVSAGRLINDHCIKTLIAWVLNGNYMPCVQLLLKSKRWDEYDR